MLITLSPGPTTSLQELITEPSEVKGDGNLLLHAKERYRITMKHKAIAVRSNLGLTEKQLFI